MENETGLVEIDGGTVEVSELVSEFYRLREWAAVCLGPTVAEWNGIPVNRG